jgi:hypothetical protein
LDTRTYQKLGRASYVCCSCPACAQSLPPSSGDVTRAMTIPGVLFESRRHCVACCGTIAAVPAQAILHAPERCFRWAQGQTGLRHCYYGTTFSPVQRLAIWWLEGACTLPLPS